MHVGDLSGTATPSKGNSWTATVSTLVVTDGGTPVSGAMVSGTWSTGGSSTCSTSMSGGCSVSVTLNTRKDLATTFMVVGVTHATLTYEAGSTTSIRLTLA